MIFQNLNSFFHSIIGVSESTQNSAQDLSLGHLLLAAICLILSGFLSGMEAGVLSLNRERLRTYYKQGKKSAAILINYLSQPADFLWTILAGNILFSFAALFSLVLALLNPARQNPWLFAICFLLFIIIYVTLFDLLPKTLFQKYPTRLCMYSVGIFRFISIVLKPLVWVVSHFGNLFLNPSRESSFFDKFYESRDQIKSVLKDSAQVFSTEEDHLITKVINLGDKPISHWMRPIETTIQVAPDDSVFSFVEKCKETTLNRLPVTQQSNDGVEAIGEIGLFPVLFDGLEHSPDHVSKHMLPPLFFPTDYTVHQALSTLQKNGRRMAVIVGRNQEALGIVTLNDVLGILFGEVDI